MCIDNLAEAEKWTRFRAANPGYHRLAELLNEYDRRGDEIKRLQAEIADYRDTCRELK